tara:strand:- start:275 stop:496 length:222 start_codon:yes stop_codon:yes gene_type:complete
MQYLFKKVILSFVFNGSLFLILMIGIQNSSNKGKVNFYSNETINLPISFIIGTSFISGSFAGTLISLLYGKKN